MKLLQTMRKFDYRNFINHFNQLFNLDVFNEDSADFIIPCNNRTLFSYTDSSKIPR